MSDSKKLTIVRTINAPIDRVWQAWTDAEQVQQWWGPKGATNPTCVWESQPGGKIDIVMLAGPELGPMAGQEWPMNGKFQTVIEQQKLVFKTTAVSRGKSILENQVTVTFKENGSNTELTVDIEVTKITGEGEMALQGMEAGWNQQLDKLTERVKEV